MVNVLSISGLSEEINWLLVVTEDFW